MDELDFSEDDVVEITEEDFVYEEVDYVKPTSKKTTRHYINNADFCAALIEYKKVVEDCESKGIKPPPIPDYIGKCFLKISEGMSRNVKFFRYPFKEDAVGDGILNCIRYWRNFDPEKTRNAFSYFSQYIFNAFVKKINTEQKEQYLKYKSTESFLTLDESEMYEDGDSDTPHEIYENMNSFIKRFEEKEREKEFKRKEKIKEKNIASSSNGIERFL